MPWLRRKLESIVFAGLKPSGGVRIGGLKPSRGWRSQEAPVPESWFGRLLVRIDRFIAGGPVSYPQYLTHRTWGQKLRIWTLVAIPLLLLSGGVALTLSRYFGPPKVRPAAQPTAAEIIHELPNFKDLKIERNHLLDVGEVRVERGPGARMLGQVKNLTDREIPRAEIDCDLTDREGTRLGSTTVVVEHVPASGTKRFEVNLKQTTAAIVLVREVRAQEVKAQ